MNTDLLYKTFDRVVKIINDSYDNTPRTIHISILNNHVSYNSTGQPGYWASRAELKTLEDEMQCFMLGQRKNVSIIWSIFDHMNNWLRLDNNFPENYYKLATLKDVKSLEELEVKLDLLGL